MSSSPRLPRRSREERERIVLDAAAELFYARGVHEVGMDELVEHSGLGKATVYRLYSTKDQLIGAYLERTHVGIMEAIDTDIVNSDGPASALRRIVQSIWEHVNSPGFRGCPFNNASIEFDDAEHPARAMARRHRTRLCDRLVNVADRLDPERGAEIGERLAVVIDGIYLNAAHLGPSGPAASGHRLALALIDELERGA
ncbi:MAG: TetR/AcrR family transcriptional regulator [Actinomycetota bacterium]